MTLLDIIASGDSAAIEAALKTALADLQRTGTSSYSVEDLVKSARSRQHDGSWTTAVAQAFGALLHALQAPAASATASSTAHDTALINGKNDFKASEDTPAGPESGAFYLDGDKIVHDKKGKCHAVRVDTEVSNDGILKLSNFGAVWMEGLEYDIRTTGSKFSVRVSARALAPGSEIMFGISANRKLWGHGPCDAITFRITNEVQNQYATWLRAEMYGVFLAMNTQAVDVGKWATFVATFTRDNVTVAFEDGRVIVSHGMPDTAPLKGVFGLLNYRAEPTEYRSVQAL